MPSSDITKLNPHDPRNRVVNAGNKTRSEIIKRRQRWREIERKCAQKPPKGTLIEAINWLENQVQTITPS